jgi:hypothetical protein
MKLTKQEKDIFAVLSDLMTIRFAKSDLKNWTNFYFHSKVRLCVTIGGTFWLPAAWFKNGGENLERTGFSTVQELAAWLEAGGAHRIKKPVSASKSYPPIYD